MLLSELYIQFRGQGQAELNSDMDKVKGNIEGVSKAADGMGHMLKTVLEIYVIGKIKDALRVFDEMGSQLYYMSQRTGVSVEALSELGEVAEHNGSSIEGLEHAFRFMESHMDSAAEGAGQATEKLQELGIAFDDLRGKKPEKQFEQIAEGISKLREQNKKTAQERFWFGRGGTAMAGVIERGARGIQEDRAEVRASGMAWTTEDAKRAKELHVTFQELWHSIKMISVGIGSALAPAFKKIAEVVTIAARGVKDFIGDNKDLIAGLALLAAALYVIVAHPVVTIITGITLAVIGLSNALKELTGRSIEGWLDKFHKDFNEAYTHVTGQKTTDWTGRNYGGADKTDEERATDYWKEFDKKNEVTPEENAAVKRSKTAQERYRLAKADVDYWEKRNKANPQENLGEILSGHKEQAKFYEDAYKTAMKEEKDLTDLRREKAKEKTPEGLELTRKQKERVAEREKMALVTGREDYVNLLAPENDIKRKLEELALEEKIQLKKAEGNKAEIVSIKALFVDKRRMIEFENKEAVRRSKLARQDAVNGIGLQREFVGLTDKKHQLEMKMRQIDLDYAKALRGTKPEERESIRKEFEARKGLARDEFNYSQQAKGGRFQGLGDLWKQLQSAALGPSNDQQIAVNTKETAKNTKTIANNLKDWKPQGLAP